MLDNVVGGSRQHDSARRRAEALLAEGIPLWLNAAAAAGYAQECRRLWQQLGEPHSLLTIKLQAAALIAPSVHGEAQPVGGAASLTADDVFRGAQRLGGEVARGYALAARGMTLNQLQPERTSCQIRVAEEILDIAARHDEAALTPVAYAMLLTALLEQGEIRLLDLELLEHQSADVALRERPYANPAVWFRCLRLILDGDTVNAERQARLLFEASPHNGTLARALFTTQLGIIRWMQGRLDDVEDGFLASRREYPEQLFWPASLAWLWLQQGRTASSETLLRSLPPPSEIPRDRYWLSTMTVLAEIARHTGSRDNALRLRDLLLPFADRLVPVGIGVSFWGTVARTLGLLEEHLGLIEDARAHLELAVETSGRIGALAWYAEAQIELAEFALRHSIPDIAAFELLAEAKATSESRGFPALAQRAMHCPRIRVLGGFEVVSRCGIRAEWTSRKARELLKMLVAAQGVPTSREVFMEVLWPGEDPEELSNRFSVAVNVIRRAFDPGRSRPTQYYVVTEGDTIRLELGHVDVDLERFLALAKKPDPASRLAAKELYRGAAFAEEPYADWAVEVRDHAAHIREQLDS